MWEPSKNRTFDLVDSAESLDRLRDLDAACDRFDFPREKADFTFSDTCIYWQKAGQDGPAAEPPP